MTAIVDLLRILVSGSKWLLVVLGIIVYIIVGAVVNYRKLSRFPGPPLAGFSRFWLFWQATRHRCHFAQQEALQKYGSPCRIGPNLLVTDDSDLIRHLSSPRSKWTRSAWYMAMRFDPRRDTVFSTRDEKTHTDLRAKEIGAYSGRELDNIEGNIDATIIEFLEVLRESHGKPVNFGEVAQLFTLDVLSKVAFGKCFGTLSARKDIFGYGKASEDFLPISELMSNHAFFRMLFGNPLMQKIAAPKDTDEVGLGRVVKFARGRVEERFKNAGKIVDEGGQDMISHFMAKGLDQLQCEAEANLQILAGSDSTTTVLRCTLYLLAGSPVCYGRLRAEVDRAIADGAVSHPVVTYAETEDLAYLRACIWEGMRMYPPLFGMKIKSAPKGGDTIKGTYFPEGTEIGQCDAAVCRNKREWGDDSDLFRPDRWLEADEEKRRRYENIVGCIFGTGRWTCLGKHIASVELHKVLFELIKHFDWAIADPMRGVKMVGHSIWVQKNLILTAQPRSIGA